MVKRRPSQKPVSELSLTNLTDLVYKGLIAEADFEARIGKRLTQAKKELRERCDEQNKPEEDILLEGQRGSLLVGPKGNQRKIRSVPKLFEVVKRILKLDFEKFLTFCSITLETLDAWNLPEEELKELVSQARTGTRPIKAIPKTEKEKAA